MLRNFNCTKAGCWLSAKIVQCEKSRFQVLLGGPIILSACDLVVRHDVTVMLEDQEGEASAALVRLNSSIGCLHQWITKGLEKGKHEVWSCINCGTDVIPQDSILTPKSLI